MVEFPSVVDAVACALEVQRSFARHNHDADPGREIRVRIGGPAAEHGRTLVLVVERLSRIEAGKLVRWAWLINRLSAELPLKVLARGRRSLHDLCTGCTDLADTSPFESLKQHEVGPWTREEVTALVTERGGDSASAEVVYRVSGGHPALVGELLERAGSEIRRGDEDGLRARALSSDHLRRLRREVERDAVAGKELERMAGGDLGRRNGPGEDRLRWLGIIAEDDGATWRWTAPGLKVWAAATPAATAPD